MKATITVIVDNIPQGKLKSEWGLAFFIEYGDKKILIDTGASALFAENFKMLGISLADVDYAVLSHAHYDHANGMPFFLEENKKAKFYLRHDVKTDCYAKFGFIKKYIGIPKNVLTDYADRMEFVSGDYRLCDGVYLIPHKSAGLKDIGRRENMYRKTTNGYVPDDFSHEQSVVLDTEQGLVIVNSCSHGGAVNIVHEVMETFPGKKVYGLIGGFHLFNKSNRKILKVAQELKETGICYVCTGHCTKERAYGIMKKELGNRLEQFHVGLKMEF